jgi:hypothetical protein
VFPAASCGAKQTPVPPPVHAAPGAAQYGRQALPKHVVPFAHWFVEVQNEPCGPPPASTQLTAPVFVFVTSHVSVAPQPHWGATPHALLGGAVVQLEPESGAPVSLPASTGPLSGVPLSVPPLDDEDEEDDDDDDDDEEEEEDDEVPLVPLLELAPGGGGGGGALRCCEASSPLLPASFLVPGSVADVVSTASGLFDPFAHATTTPPPIRTTMETQEKVGKPLIGRASNTPQPMCYSVLPNLLTSTYKMRPA